MRIELLVDAAAFSERLREDLAGARRTAYLQTFSFEGDRVGIGLGRRLEASPAADRRLLVDGYSRVVHNDRIIPGPAWLDRTFRREVFLTHRWVRRLRREGVGVRFGNPLGPNPLHILRRNHKKLAVFDEEVVYLGGINFCEHNFEWHDMMLRVEDADLGRLLADDFRASWRGEPRPSDHQIGPLRIVSLNGRGNPAGLAPVVQALDGARSSIDLVSAYLSPPITAHLAAARKRGVRIRILTPEENNKPNLRRFVLASARRHGFEILLYPGRMSHMKAAVVDDELLIAGSYNFCSMGYHILEELVVLTRDADTLDAFRSRVWDPDVACSHALPRPPRPGLRTLWGHAAVRLGARVASFFAPA